MTTFLILLGLSLFILRSQPLRVALGETGCRLSKRRVGTR